MTREEVTQWLLLCRSMFLSGEDSYLQQGVDGNSIAGAWTQAGRPSVCQRHQQPMGRTEGRGVATGTLDLRDLIRGGDLCRKCAARSGALALVVNTRRCGPHRKTLLSGDPRGLQSHPQRAPRGRLCDLCETAIESVLARLCGSILAPAAFDDRAAHRENPQELTTVLRPLAAEAV